MLFCSLLCVMYSLLRFSVSLMNLIIIVSERLMMIVMVLCW